ncbi:hypothetical protein MMC34_001678 [Xylographa carneopallida]|nr:hypothetical protein [Xylographa carneopallida]
MDVVSFVFAALGFVDQAVKTGTVLKKLVQQYPVVASTIINAVVRLEAQKYTLQLWHQIWTEKAAQKFPGGSSTESSLQELWSEQGYNTILECLGQVNIKFGEAHRILASIDPNSLASTAHLQAGRDNHAAPSNSKSAAPKTSTDNVATPSSLKPPDNIGLGRRSSRAKMKRWYHRLTSSSDSLSTDPTTQTRSPTDELATAAHERSQLASDTLKLEMSPGTKFKWSLSLKDDLRLLLAEIDDWLGRLQVLATSCEEHRAVQAESGMTAGTNIIHNAAKALYSAVLKTPQLKHKEHRVGLKLEREHNRAEYFDGLLGPVSYVDDTGRSLKFPLLVTDSLGQEGRFIVIAETLKQHTASANLGTLKTAASFSEIVEDFARISESRQSSSIALVDPNSDLALVIHFVHDPQNRPMDQNKKLSQSSFEDVLAAEPSSDPLMSRWKRLQIACTIAVSVLYLHETGWIANPLQSTNFQFLGLAESNVFDMIAAQPVISAQMHQNVTATQTTPFDCLKRSTAPSTFNVARNERLLSLFHHLGIVLFELGRGARYEDLFPATPPSQTPTSGDTPGHKPSSQTADTSATAPCNTTSPTEKEHILAEVEKIPFGRTYRELVKVCLEGRLYATSTFSVDMHFQKAIVEQLLNLEKHFSAIIVGE